MHFATLLSLSCALRLAAAAVIWIPAEFDPQEDANLIRRDSLVSCPASLPSHFTCPQSTTCLPLNTTSSIQAALCCPAGEQCSLITPINCDQSLQNATANPNSPLHVDPPTQLASCGSACCPPGYSCTNGQCQSLPQATTSTSASALASTTPTATPSRTNAAVVTVAPSATPDNLSGGSQTRPFSGAAFAAGFIPGILLGALITACIIFCLLRRRRQCDDSFTNEKQSQRDTLTDLGTLSRRPTMHGRSISEPTADPTAGHRTDFIRGTPPRLPELVPDNNHSYVVEATGPITPARTPNAVRALFSRSPFLNHTPPTPIPTQPPMPAHLKRGTLSYTISPVRALKKQKSMHSLRRQMTDASNGSRRNRPDVSRSGSTETIKVLMPSNEPYTPDQRLLTRVAEDAPATLESNVYRGPAESSSSTWRTASVSSEEQAAAPQQQAPYASSSRYPTQTYTPTRVPAAAKGNTPEHGGLGTPYTPSRYYGNNNNNNNGGNGVLPTGQGKPWVDVLIGDDGGLRVVREQAPARDKRDTTFSAMMERAGLRKSDLVMGTGDRSAL